jgi:hypothetical protein
MPAKISAWFLIVYFLLVALGDGGFSVWTAPAVVMGIVALGVAVLLFLDR